VALYGGGGSFIIKQRVSEGVELAPPARVAKLHAKGHLCVSASSHVSSHIHPFCVTVSGMSHLSALSCTDKKILCASNDTEQMTFTVDKNV